MVDTEQIPSPMRRLRDAKRLTQQQLAFDTGLSLRTIQNVEAGAEPGLKTARLIAKALGTTVDGLFGAAA